MKSITRRSFLKTGLAIGAASMVGRNPMGILSAGPNTAFAAAPADLGIVKGTDYFQNTIDAVELIGGMSRFVSRGANVGLLVNSPFKNPGTHTHPDVALAVVKMCHDMGAKQIITLKGEGADYYQGAGRYSTYKKLVGALKKGGEFVTRDIPGGIALKKADIVKELPECDVFINLSIVKHHEGTGMSCILKNMMGALPHSTCRFFHQGTGTPGWYGDLGHMDQCIADINLFRKPDLSIADATEFITTNGPFGPGRMAKPLEVVAGADAVLLDAYCCTHLGLRATEVGMITRSVKHGIGKPDVSRATVRRKEA